MRSNKESFSRSLLCCAWRRRFALHIIYDRLFDAITWIVFNGSFLVVEGKGKEKGLRGDVTSISEHVFFFTVWIVYASSDLWRKNLYDKVSSPLEFW